MCELLPTMDAFSRRYQTILLHLVMATMLVTIAVECGEIDSNRDNCTWPSTAPPGAIPGVDINNRRTEPVAGLPGYVGPIAGYVGVVVGYVGL